MGLAIVAIAIVSRVPAARALVFATA